MTPPPLRHTDRQESGAALLIVLLVLLIVAGASASFIWYMNRQQGLAGSRLRSAAAMAAAEAGVHRVLAILESAPQQTHGQGRTWRPTSYREAVAVGALGGHFTVSLADTPDGAVVITSTGDVGGLTRRLRVRVHLASRALLAGVYGTSIVRLEKPPAATFVVPYGSGVRDLPWVHIASGQGIWLASSGVSLNDPTARPVTEPGPVDVPSAIRRSTGTTPAPGLRLLLAAAADLRVDEVFQPIDALRLRAMGFAHEITVMRMETLPAPPAVDEAYYQARAASNIGNAALNQAAGKYTGDGTLERKADSLYTADEFERILTYLSGEPNAQRLQGIVYVRGGVALQQRQRLSIVDGTLVAEGDVRLDTDAALDVTHSTTTRALPAVIALGKGELFLAAGARLRTHGLIYVTRVFELSEGADADIVGGILSSGLGFSLVNTGARAVIRYDPAVLGTPGLSVPADEPVVAWIVSWEEAP